MPTTAPEVSLPWAKLCVCLALVAITAAVYWPARHFDFIDYDDPEYVIDNPHVQSGVTWDGIRWAFGRLHGEHTYWHPVTWMSHMLDCQVFGLAPGGHHFINVLFHLLNTVLVFLVFLRLTGALERCAVLSGLFALHPLQVNTVAWVAERKNLLATLFGLLAIWAYAAYVKAEGNRQKAGSRSPDSEYGNTPHAARFTFHLSRFTPSAILHPPSSILYLLSLALFALSLMSKPTLVTLPCLLLLLDYWPLSRLSLKTQNSKLKTLLPLLREKLPFFALSAASSAITIQAHRGLGMLEATADLPLGFRFENALVSYASYLGNAFWPSKLAISYPLPVAWPTGIVALSGALLLGLSALAIGRMRNWPYLLVGWFWFLGALVPFIGLIQVGGQARADRFAYLPLVGLLLAVVWMAAEMTPGWAQRSRSARGAVILLLLMCGLLSRRQAGYWRDSITLFERALAVTTNNAMAHACLGTAYVNQNREADALTEFSRALTLKPAFAKPLLAMAEGFYAAERLNLAAAVFRRILEMTPDDAATRCRLGSVVARQGNLDEAIAHYEAALELNPHYEPARTNLAAALTLRKQREAATHYSAGAALLNAARPQQAVKEFADALRLRPDWPEVQNNLAWLLATHASAEVRDGPWAVSLAERACALTQHTNWSLLSTLAAAYAEAGRFPQAVSTQQKVCDLATAGGQNAQVESSRRRLDLYRSGHAYRQP
jgi:protein O-mannosyl-transferase